MYHRAIMMAIGIKGQKKEELRDQIIMVGYIPLLGCKGGEMFNYNP